MKIYQQRPQTKEEKKTNLCSSINLSLPSILPLTQHRSSQQLVPILSTSQISSLQKYSSPIVPRQTLPVVLRSQGTINRSFNRRLVCFMIKTQMLCMVGRNWLFCGFSGFNLDKDIRIDGGR
jgi:hypothetical protein